MTSTRTATEPALPGPALRDLDDGSLVDRALLVGDVQRCTRRSGSDYLRLTVADRTTRLPGVMWEPSRVAEGGSVLRVVGKVSDHPRYGRQVIVSELHPSEPGEADLSALVAGPEEEPAELEERLRLIIDGIEDRWLRDLLDALIGPDGELRGRFLRAPAAKYNHHAYPGGLLEHTLQVAEGVSAIAALHPAIDRGIALAGALLHDIGKLDAYDDDPVGCDLTDRGRLESEIPLGYFRVRRAIDNRPGSPDDRAQGLLHIILSHHGLREHGSPVVPCTREATVVHAMDELSAQLGAFDRLERETAHAESWSRYDHVLATAAWLPQAVGSDDTVASPLA